MLELLHQVFSAEQCECLDLDSLKLGSESFISDELKESLSDLVYTARFKGEENLRICLLFEHKSSNPGRRIYPQIGRYMIGVQEDDLNQGRELFTPTVLVLFYHGKEPWNPVPLSEQYGPVPEVFKGFGMNFNFSVVNLQSKSDDEIRSMENAMLLRNIFLAFKHAREDDFFRINYKEVLIFASEKVSEDIILTLFFTTINYIYNVSSIKKQEIMNMVEKMPPQYETSFRSLFDEFMEEGRQEGRQEGREEGRQEEATAKQRTFTLKLWALQQFSVTQIAELVDIPESEVRVIILTALQEEGRTAVEAEALLLQYEENFDGQSN